MAMFGRLWRIAFRNFNYRIYSRLERIEQELHGSRATYVGNNRVLVKCVVRGMTIAYYVEADDRLLAPWFIVTGKYETEVTDFLLRELQPESHCIDVGANFGYFTCLMARLSPQGKVIGIEADSHVHALVRDNIAINDLMHARAMHAAAAAVAGEIELFRRTSRSGNTSIAPVERAFTDLLGEPPVEPFRVPAIRIDDLLDELGGRVDVMKIDVEGAEPLVIAGAEAAIATNPRLSIVMEWSPGQIRAASLDVWDFLRDLDARHLRPHDLDAGRLVPLSYDELANLPYRAGIVLKR